MACTWAGLTPRPLTRFVGRKSEKPGGGTFSWGDALLRPAAATASQGDLQPSLYSYDVTGVTGSEKNVPVTPLDEYNVTLLDNVKPKNWKDPDPGDAKWGCMSYWTRVCMECEG